MITSYKCANCVSNCYILYSVQISNSPLVSEMAELDIELINYLERFDLNNDKWISFLNGKNISTLKQMFRQDLYEEALLIASEDEYECIECVFSIKVAEDGNLSAVLHNAGLKSDYWSMVLATHYGLTTEGSVKYVDFPYIFQFARFSEERFSLQNLLKINPKNNITDWQKNQCSSFKKRKRVIEMCLCRLKLNAIENEFTDINAIKKLAFECLLVPAEFLPQNVTHTNFVNEMECFCKEMTHVYDKVRLINDSNVVKNASDGLALRGVYYQHAKFNYAQNSLINIPSDVSLQSPLLPQRIKCMPLPPTVFEFGVEEELFGQLDNGGKQLFCSIKSFIVPTASCFFNSANIKLTDAAVKQLQIIESMPMHSDAAKELIIKFYRDYGSHVNLGPFHFGGYYYWQCNTTVTDDKDLVVITRFHEEVIKCVGICSSIDIQRVHNVCNIQCLQSMTLPWNNGLMQHTTMEIKALGGPQTSSSPIWKNCLLADSTKWVLLDSGTTKFPVWDLVRNDTQKFKNGITLSDIMKMYYDKISLVNNESKILPIKRDFDSFIMHIRDCKITEDDNEYYLHLVHYVAKTKNDMIKSTKDLSIWPIVYLSHESVQRCLMSILEAIIKKHPQSDHIQNSMKEIVRPYELLALPESSLKQTYVTVIYEKCNLTPLRPCDMHIMVDICTAPQNVDATHVTVQPGIVTSALSHIIGYLRKTEQIYEELYILALVMPYNYDPTNNVFLSSFTEQDQASLGNAFEENTDIFYNNMKDNTNREQLLAYLILLYQSGMGFYSPKNAYFQKVLEMAPREDMGESLLNILSDLVDDNKTFDSVKTELIFISKGIERGESNTALKMMVNIQPRKIDRADGIVKKVNIIEKADQLFKMLNLSEHFPEKLTLKHALEVRSDTLQILCGDTNTICSCPTIYPWLMLHKIMSFNSKCRMALIDEESVSGDSSDEEDSCIHPLDGLLALLQCADNFLRQDLICRLAQCQIAVPLILPIATKDDELIFTLWAMRTINKQWYSVECKSFHDIPIISYQSPIISFIRFGNHCISKSNTLNLIMDLTDSFYHHNCEGGTVEKILVPGVVEVNWYFPSERKKNFKDAITFLNMHGDARDFEKQVNLLSKISFMTFVFANESDLNDGGNVMLKKFLNVPGGVVILTNHKFQRDPCTTLCLRNLNEDKIKKQICRLINKSLNCQQGSELYLKLEDCSKIAIECGIIVDEGNDDCTKGKQMADDIKSVILSNKMPKDLLRLQGRSLWHEWASKEKEYYRHKTRGMQSIEEHTRRLKEEMNNIRAAQLHSCRNLNPLMKKFLTHLLSSEGPIRSYFLQWLIISLRDVSRDTLSPLERKYSEKECELADLEEQDCGPEIVESTRKELKTISSDMVNANFGLEHLLREISQIYEAMQLESDEFKDIISRLPDVAAHILIDGYPLELMDGDTAHVAVSWVTAVLNEVTNILKDPSIMVISIVGLQASGKSTLLNTLFGVKFNVSAGKCTRGAFMRLLPVHPSLRKEYKCKYFLLVDTEGLRDVSLDVATKHNTDNVIATFAIGLANLTIVNIFGETPGDLEDILQIAVHAFLRMRAVNLRPGCHFVHQNISAVNASEKMRIGRSSLKENLDKMTAAAAKKEQLECTMFSDVIRFKDERDVSNFPGLFNGTLPMASVNEGYSEQATFLRRKVVDFMKEMNASHSIINLSTFTLTLKQLWMAILVENFVFSFKNTLETLAYSALDNQILEWTWSFQRDMLLEEQKMENALANTSGDEDRHKSIFEKHKNALDNKCKNRYELLCSEVEKYFTERHDREIIEKWKTETESQLLTTKMQATKHAETRCQQIWSNHVAKVKLRRIREKHRKVIVKQVQKLASELQEQKLETLNDLQLQQQFEHQWQEWVCDLPSVPVQLDDKLRNIELSVQASLEKHFKAESSKINQMQREKSLKEWGGTALELEIVPNYVSTMSKRAIGWITSKIGLTKEWKEIVEMLRDDIFKDVKEYLAKISDCEYSPAYTDGVILKLKEKLTIFSAKNYLLKITPDFTTNMALTICGYSCRRFQEMLLKFYDENNMQKSFEREAKTKYFQLFKDLYHKNIDVQHIICNVLQGELQKAVFKELPIRIVACLRDQQNPHHISNKKKLMLTILKRIAEDLHRGDTSSCLFYIQAPDLSIRNWIGQFIDEFCDSGDVSTIVINTLNELVTYVQLALNRVSKQIETEFEVSAWIEMFKNEVGSRMEVDLSEAEQVEGKLKFDDIGNFTEVLLNGIEVVCSSLHHELGSFSSKDLKKLAKAPHDILYDGGNGIAGMCGCLKTCPFCNEPCSLREGHEGMHKVVMGHKPQFLHGIHYEDEMVSETCTTAVYEKMYFKNDDTDNKWYYYHKAENLYKGWRIEGSISEKGSIYWEYAAVKMKDKMVLLHEGKINIPTEWEHLKFSDALADLRS